MESAISSFQNSLTYILKINNLQSEVPSNCIGDNSTNTTDMGLQCQLKKKPTERKILTNSLNILKNNMDMDRVHFGTRHI
jgi:hypothetical protein